MLTIYHLSDGKQIRGHGLYNDAEKKAESYCKEKGTRIIKVERSEKPFRGRVRDSIPDEPHFNNALGCIIKSRKHYYQILRERGLTEIGNELYIPKDSRERKGAGYFSQEKLQKIASEYNIPISDNYGDHLVDLDKKDKLNEGIEHLLEDDESGAEYNQEV